MLTNYKIYGRIDVIKGVYYFIALAGCKKLYSYGESFPNGSPLFIFSAIFTVIL